MHALYGWCQRATCAERCYREERSGYMILDGSGAVVKEGIDFYLAFEYMTKVRADRGWMVLTPDNQQLRTMAELAAHGRALRSKPVSEAPEPNVPAKNLNSEQSQ